MVANRGPVTSGVTLAMVVLATVFVLARFYTRGVLVRSIKQDDWWILGAWFCAVGFSAAICVGVSDGLGMHWADVEDPTRRAFRQAQYAYSILYNPCLMLTKTSIIIFYISVMSKDVDPIFRWCNWITLAVVNVAGTALTCLNIFQCRPISAGYQYPVPPEAKCADIVTLYLSSAPVNIITDLALLLLPMPILTGLRLPKKQKIILVCTFSAGIFVAVVDIVRIAYLQTASLDRIKVQDSGSGPQSITESSDFSWYASLSFMWSAIEVNVGIICACVPSLKPLFLKFAPNFIKDATDEISPLGSLDMEEKQDEPLSTLSTDMSVITHPAAFRKPHVSEYSGDDDGDYMGFLNMLSGPDDDAPKSGFSKKDRKETTVTSRTLTRTTSAVSQASDFGFVKMDGTKNMLKLNNRQSLWPVAVVTFIFFLWGFAYGLLGTLNGQFRTIAHLTQGEILGLQGAYYAGYFVGPITFGRWFLHRYGFKSTMIAGLCIYGTGTMVFWPSAVLQSYAAFTISNFIVGFGLSCLEVSANPYIALCGPLEYAEVRLNFSQAFQACGTVCSPLLAQRVLFKDVLNAPSLIGVQWAYLGISLFDFALALAFYYIPLPEATEDQLEEQAEKRSAVYRTRIGPYRVVWWTLALGAFSQFCYVGAQEGNGWEQGALLTYLRGDNPRGLDAFDFETLGNMSFALGRFAGAILNYLIRPRWLLMACFIGCIILCAVQMEAEGTSGIIVNNLIRLFEGSIFPIVYAISMRGMGDQTFNAASIMTSAISSGGAIPPIVWAVSNAFGPKYSYSAELGVFAFGAIFPLYLNFVPAAKRAVDPIHETRGRSRTRRRLQRSLSVGTDTSTGTSQSDVVDEKKFGLSGILARRKKHQEAHVTGVSFMPESQHIERSTSNITPISPKASGWNDNLFSTIRPPSPVRTKSAESNVASLGFFQTGEGPPSSSDGDDRSDNDFDTSMSGASGKEYYPSDREPNRKRPEDYFTPKHDPTPDDSEDSEKEEYDDNYVVDHARTREDSGDVENMSPMPTQEKRAWTEEDDVRDDYHRVLRGF